MKRTDKVFLLESFARNDIPKIIGDLDSNKSHVLDIISIPLLKICSESILNPLEIIFKSFIEKVQFPLEWKKANVVPLQKASDKKVSKNYRLVSLVQRCG